MNLLKFSIRINKYWPVVVSLRKSAANSGFIKPMNDDRLENDIIVRWKPLHLMIYYERAQMIDDIITFSGRSFKKAITLDNRRQHLDDDSYSLKMWIILENSIIFESLWSIANIWTISHLYFVLKELKQTIYCEQIFVTILENKTTEYILYFLETDIKQEIYSMMELLIEKSADKKVKLECLLFRLKKLQPKAMNLIDENEVLNSNKNTNFQSNSDENVAHEI